MANADPIIEMAPAAGQGIMKKVADYLLAQPEFIEQMGQVIIRGLSAKTRYWDPAEKSWLIMDDCKTQVQTFTVCVANMEGEPIKRILHQHIGTGAIDPLAAMQESPALREAARAMLEKADWRTSGKQDYKVPKKAQPAKVLDVE